MKQISKNIAFNLRLLRKERAWSLDKAAHETGVSKAMLGQIEREESSPTVATLWKIATGFKVPFSSFLEKPRIGKTPDSENKDTQLFHSADGKMRVDPIFPFDQKLRFEMFVIQLLPHYEHLSPPHEKGVVEHVVVVAGEIEVLMDGIWKSLKCGEGLHFDAHKPHGYRNPASEIGTFHDIIHYPDRQQKILKK
ncbi:MAG: helix-turn-helix transcriptional regulator [Deltaproteobacteria bacterium]|nr:helix-turn-helix transcriptional regulator [Deltaproteobacteria bacterium]